MTNFQKPWKTIHELDEENKKFAYELVKISEGLIVYYYITGDTPIFNPDKAPNPIRKLLGEARYDSIRQDIKRQRDLLSHGESNSIGTFTKQTLSGTGTPTSSDIPSTKPDKRG